MIWLEIAELLGRRSGPDRRWPRARSPAISKRSNRKTSRRKKRKSGTQRSGLSGLLASIISRTTPRRILDEEVEYGDFPALPDGFVPEEAPEEAVEAAEFELPEEEVIDAAPDLRARCSPRRARPSPHRRPTSPRSTTWSAPDGRTAARDPRGRLRLPPEMPPPDAPGRDAAGRGDPLAGQPDFDIAADHRPLNGKHVLVTAGPTHEPIDPVRYIANRSSGKQGFAIAAAAAALGARVTLVSGPVTLRTPLGRGADRCRIARPRWRPR